MRLFAAAALALAIAFTQPAVAATACQYDLATTIPQLDAGAVEYAILDADKRAEFLGDLAVSAEAMFGQKPDLSKVTNVLLAVLDGEVFFGLELDGCLSPPEPLAKYLPGRNLSGFTPTGVHA